MMGKQHWVRLTMTGLLCLGSLSGFVHTVQAERWDRLVNWDVLPNGLMILEYDRGDDRVTDRFTLHPITWSGWTTQSPDELEAQACADGQWVFNVEYDHDRYAYFSQPIPVLEGEDRPGTGEWTAQPVLTTRQQIPHPDNGSVHQEACEQERR